MSTHATRWILCDHCDAIHRIRPEANELRCRHCGLEQPVPCRDSRSLAHPRSPMRQMSVAAYHSMLRGQDGQPAPMPAHLAPLVEAGDLDGSRFEEAQARFRQARLDLRRAPTALAREDLYWLALLLSNDHLAADELDRQRAVLETALDLVTLPRHRQVLRCMLGMHHAAAGDLDGAEAWIANCDPKSGDLQADSALRVLAAFVATARGQRDEVLRLLGDHHDAIPIDDAREAMAAVLRANALEKSGRRKEAVQTLMDTIGYLGPFSHRHMETFAALHPRLMLCSGSFGEVTRKRAERTKSSPVSFSTGLILLAVGLVCLALAVSTWRDIIVTGQMPTLPADSESNVAGVVFVPPIGALILIPMGFAMLGDAWRRRRIIASGMPATARLLDIQPTGLTINDVPQMRVRLLVSRPGHPAHPATSLESMPDATAEALKRGRSIAVIVDPEHPEHVVLEK